MLFGREEIKTPGDGLAKRALPVHSGADGLYFVPLATATTADVIQAVASPGWTVHW